MNTFKSLVFGSLLSVAIFSACKRTEGIVGPEYIYATENFAVVGNTFTGSKNAVDFSAGDSISWTATFTESVSWVLTIRGQASGAEYVISGLSSSIDPSNAAWITGGHTGTYFFETGESAIATLGFFGSSIELTDTFTVTDVRTWASATVLAPGQNGFEGGSFTFPWLGYNTAGPDPLSDVVTPVSPAAVEGTSCGHLVGTGAPDFVTGLAYQAPSPLSTGTSDPDSVYVNIYVYGTNNPNAFVSFQMKEADKDEPNNTYGETTDDAWDARITLDFDGWKLFSFKYSTMSISEAADFGGSGNKVQEPDRIRVVQVGLQVSQSNSYAETWVDFPTITVGAPFDPSN